MILTNNFHDSKRTVRAQDGDVISRRRATAIKRDLCGVKGCTCSDGIGRRGPQPDNDGLVIQSWNWDAWKVFRVRPSELDKSSGS